MLSDWIYRLAWLPLSAALIYVISAFGPYSSFAAAADIKVTLAGEQEVAENALDPVISANAIGFHG